MVLILKLKVLLIRSLIRMCTNFSTKNLQKIDIIYHNWECTSIYRPLSYPLRSLGLAMKKITLYYSIIGQGD